jgi:hypothetical protein
MDITHFDCRSQPFYPAKSRISGLTEGLLFEPFGIETSNSEKTT